MSGGRAVWKAKWMGAFFFFFFYAIKYDNAIERQMETITEWIVFLLNKFYLFVYFFSVFSQEDNRNETKKKKKKRRRNVKTFVYDNWQHPFSAMQYIKS